VAVLYITYNGLTEPLGQRQVLPYLLGLSDRGWAHEVISFEKEETADLASVARVRQQLRERRIRWHQLRYHRRPTFLATAYDAFTGCVVGLLASHRVDLIHARSTVPAALARSLALFHRVPWIFDVRGLVAQEYVDAGHWSREGQLFRLTERIERNLLGHADGLVLLTERIREQLRRRGSIPLERPTAVIPCSVDMRVFCPQEATRKRVRAELALVEGPVLAYAGSLGSWYRFEEMLDFFVVARQQLPDMRFLVLTMNPEVASAAVSARRLESAVIVRTVEPEHVPAHLAAADAGICFLGESVSKGASSPTKYGEYLATGLPVVTNRWTGDAARLEAERTWLLVDGFDGESYRHTTVRLRGLLADPDRTREAARSLAEREFSLDKAVDRYDALYRQVISFGGERGGP
jgi:glycosyltransferase involved in cell wall biosynthesis